MTDLHRAWNLLREGERPDGVCAEGFSTAFDPMGNVHRCSYDFARDRLIVAVEGVLFKTSAMSLRLHQTGDWNGRARRKSDEWEWRCGAYESFTSPCRLTAACDALASVRGEAADA